MYHVSEDKRAIKSAQLIWEGLEKCLQEKELGKIRIVDINQKCYVSRATFYRLFDSVQDVLMYECDLIFEIIAAELSGGHFPSSKELFLFFIRQWMEHKTLIKVLAENNLTNILYETHMRHEALLRTVYLKETELTDRELDYLISILSGMIPSVINVWYSHGQSESADELFRMVCTCISTIDAVLNA